MQCNWCAGTKGNIVDGYHPGCLDAKRRCAANKEAESKAPKIRRTRQSGYTPPPQPSSAYLQQVQDFQARMARRGVKIKVSPYGYGTT